MEEIVMKKLLVLIFALLPAACFAQASVGHHTIILDFSETTEVQIPDGYVAEILGFKRAGQGTAELTVGGFQLFSGLSGDPERFIVAGPNTLRFRTSATTNLISSYRIFANSRAGIDVVPSTAVVIPTDAEGPVEIILESSLDLISWLPAMPGTYGDVDDHRFFRVRAVLK